ncbi:MAG TPA: CoA ester lyase [Dehalococcoidia bacterium]|jgi:citrate lyase subunit beta/citryl-CoA lyase
MGEQPLDHISGRFAAPVMRSVMTVPVIVERFIEKAPGAGADVICLDLEDSVPPTEKVGARPLARKAIETMPRSDYEMYVRVNGSWSGLMEDDLNEIVRPGLDGVVISKAESAESIELLAEQLTGLEIEHGMEAGSVAIMPLIETAKGVAKCYEICKASPRLTGAIFGAEDYATDMGIERTADGAEILWARTQIAITCRAAGIEAIDTPDPDYTNADHLRREMRLAKSLGYRGKLCIHPLQVQIANEIFRPGETEVSEARLIVAAFERDGLAQGRAAIPLGGKMVDTPIYWRAKRLLELAEKSN